MRTGHKKAGGSNRTIVGLKVDCDDSVVVILLRSNRTIVGLKAAALVAFLQDVRSSNRTIVGLKGSLSRMRRTQSNWQQSHHCGIERHICVQVAVIVLQQQSHHCGIESS